MIEINICRRVTAENFNGAVPVRSRRRAKVFTLEETMGFNATFFINSILFGLGLAVDAFLISLSNGLKAPGLRCGKICAVAGVFALFQLIAPMIGWVCVHTVAVRFETFTEIAAWIAFAVLLYIGLKMFVEGLTKNSGEENAPKAGVAALFLQALITSVDALSVGFASTGYTWQMALVCSVIIAAVTFCAYFSGFLLGRRFGTKIGGKASVFGGIIFVLIGVEVLISSFV